MYLTCSFLVSKLLHWKIGVVCVYECIWEKGAFDTAYTHAQRQLVNFNRIVIVWEFLANVMAFGEKWQQHTYPQQQRQRLHFVEMFNFINEQHYNKHHHLMILFAHSLTHSLVRRFVWLSSRFKLYLKMRIQTFSLDVRVVGWYSRAVIWLQSSIKLDFYCRR